MASIATKIGPSDHGRRMSLAEFEHAEVQDGYLYELGRGVIIVSEVPNPWHFLIVNLVSRQLRAFDLAHPDQFLAIGGGAECKILVDALGSERHPDLAVYKTPPPRNDSGAWSVWVPELVIEVVSSGSRRRDYEEKPEEYLRFGVQEYWIVDVERQELHVFSRDEGRWAEQVIGAEGTYRTGLLPGFEFACGPVFQAARDAEG